MILLCGSCLLPFAVINLVENAKAYSDADYETYAGQGKANADEMDQTQRYIRGVPLKQKLSGDLSCALILLKTLK